MKGAQADSGSERDIVPRPEGLEVVEEGRSLLLSKRWFTPAIFGLAFFCVIWDSFLVFWYGVAFSGEGPEGPGALMMVVFPLGHVAVGVGLTYFTVASFLNTTTLEITGEAVTVHHGPVRWPGSQVVPSDDIEQVYCNSLTSTPSKRRTTTRYRVKLAMRDGSSRTLLKGLTDLETALYVEQAIEVKLGIQNRRVGGEVGRSSRV